jgi:hypothetical protein
MCFVWIWEQTAIISLYSINWLVFVTETECIYCAVRTGSLYIILRSAYTVYLCVFLWMWEQTAIISLCSINCLGFYALTQNFEKQLLASLCLSIRVEKLGFHWTDFHEIWYFRIFKKKSVEKIHVQIKFDKNNGYLTRRPVHIHFNTSMNSSQNEKCFTQKCRVKTRLLHSIILPDIRAVYEIILYSKRGHRWPYNAAQKIHALYPR